MCLPCLRATTLELLVDIVCLQQEHQGLIQKFGNTHSMPGEYRVGALIFCPPNGPVHNMPLPIVRHQRNNYRTIVRDGVHFLEQLNVDFVPAP